MKRFQKDKPNKQKKKKKRQKNHEDGRTFFFGKYSGSVMEGGKRSAVDVDG